MEAEAAVLSEPVYFTLAQVAGLTNIEIKTLYDWIYHGKLNEARGLRRIGNKRLVEWAIFKAAIDQGDFA